MHYWTCSDNRNYEMTSKLSQKIQFTSYNYQFCEDVNAQVKSYNYVNLSFWNCPIYCIYIKHIVLICDGLFISFILFFTSGQSHWWVFEINGYKMHLEWNACKLLVSFASFIWICVIKLSALQMHWIDFHQFVILNNYNLIQALLQKISLPLAENQRNGWQSFSQV